MIWDVIFISSFKRITSLKEDSSKKIFVKLELTWFPLCTRAYNGFGRRVHWFLLHQINGMHACMRASYQTSQLNYKCIISLRHSQTYLYNEFWSRNHRSLLINMSYMNCKSTFLIEIRRKFLGFLCNWTTFPRSAGPRNPQCIFYLIWLINLLQLRCNA